MEGTPSSGSEGTLKLGPRWASAGWTLRNHPGHQQTKNARFPTIHKPIKPSPPRFIKINPILVRLPALLSSPADSLSDGCSSSCCGWRRVNLLQNNKKKLNKTWHWHHFLHIYHCLLQSTDWSSLTGREAASEEHVEEVFRSDVGLETPVEVEASSVRVARAAWLFSSCQVILSSFVWVAQHCICITDLWKDSQTA